MLLAPALPLPLPLPPRPLPVADDGALPESLVPLESEAACVDSRSGAGWLHEMNDSRLHALSDCVRTGGGGTIGELVCGACCCCCCSRCCC